MFLKEIHLENFKSFGKKMKVPIPKGFTAITGPNGSGKSNLSDAILFVLGPRSPKKIRAARLTDLIFNGGPTGRGAKYTKVSLVFDNSDRMMPFNNNEVTLTRLVKISPTDKEKYYSYFYVNGKSSSLNEFSNLLANCRISADGYNIVQQGDIQGMINMGSVDRRRILDEMAGITKFDEQINKANKQREKVESNVEKLELILSEIEKNLAELKKDKENAIKYKELKDELVSTKSNLAFREKYELETQLAGHHNQVAKLIADKESMTEKVEELSRKMAKDQTDLADVEEEIAERGGEEGRRLKEQIDGIRLKIFEDKAQIEAAEDSITDAKRELEFSKRDMKQLTKSLKDLELQMGKDQKELLKVKGSADEAKEKLDGIEKEISQTNVNLMELNRDMTKLNQTLESVIAQRHEAELAADRLSKQSDDIRADLARLEEELKTADFNLKDAQWQMEELKKETKGEVKESPKALQAAFMKAKAKERKLQDEARDLEDAVTRLNREYQKLKAMQDAQEQAKRGYTKAIDAIMDAKARGNIKGVIGTIAQLGEVSAEYEEALSVAAGARMMAIVVEDDQSAADCISYLRKNKLGRATFLPLNKLMPGHPRGKSLIASRDPSAVGFAIELINFDEKYRNAFWYVFQDTVVVKDLDASRRLMGGVRLVTLDGSLTDPQGGMSGGSRMKDRKVSFGKESASQLEGIAGELSKAQIHADSVAEELRVVRAEIDQLEGKLRDASGKEGEVLKQMEVIKLRIDEFKKQSDSMTKEVNGKNAELEKAKKKVADAEGEIAGFTSKIEKFEKDKEELRKKIADATPQKLRDTIEKLKAQISDMEEKRRDLASAIETANSQKDTFLGRKEEVERAQEGYNATITESKTKITEAKANIAELDKELTSLRKVEETMNTALKGLNEKRDKLRENITRREETINNAREKLNSYDDLVNAEKIKIVNVEDTLAEVMGRLQAYESIQMSDAEIIELPPSDDLKRKIASYESRIERLGDVNMKALEDYEYQEGRRTEIKTNLKDLEQEKEQLVKMVEGLITNKKEGLMKVFDAVNENFGVVYHEISNGGEGGLKLENEEDPFEGGLAIWARPPGKKVHRINALSGGEKSIAAMSFIFAMQGYDPSPFYLLDEIDQNLDAINTEIVAKRIKAHSEYAQFIMVTLHKAALKEAEHVYGATIQRNGITDLIGVKVSEIDTLDLGESGDSGSKKAEAKDESSDETPIKEPDGSQPPQAIAEGFDGNGDGQQTFEDISDTGPPRGGGAG